MELHTQTRSTMYPDPEYDSIQGIFYHIYNMIEENPSKTSKKLQINIQTNKSIFLN